MCWWYVTSWWYETSRYNVEYTRCISYLPTPNLIALQFEPVDRGEDFLLRGWYHKEKISGDP